MRKAMLKPNPPAVHCRGEGRQGDRLKTTPETFSGFFWTGQQAVEMGLADKLGNLDYVAREVVKAEDIIDYTRRDNVAERLVKRFGAAMSMGAGAAKAATSITHRNCVKRRVTGCKSPGSPLGEAAGAFYRGLVLRFEDYRPMRNTVGAVVHGDPRCRHCFTGKLHSWHRFQREPQRPWPVIWPAGCLPQCGAV